MKKLIVKSGLLLAAMASIFTGCESDNGYSTPESTLVTTELVTTKSVADINAMATSAPTLYTSDDVIEAYVTSSDEAGNFYKSISFQSVPAALGTPVGFSVPVNFTTMFGKGFSPGRKVYIKLQGLYIAKVYGSLQIGASFEGGIGRIAENQWKSHLFPSATILNEDDLVRVLPFSAVFTDANQNTLIEIADTEFDAGSINRTYYDVDSGGGATDHLITSTTAAVTSQILRISSFAPFSGNTVPSGSGTIRGVLSKYQSDFQFMIRYEDDIKLTGSRILIHAALGGTNIVFDGSVNENFTSYNVNNKVFPDYVNDHTASDRYWAVKQYPTGTGNKYIEMTSFASSGSVTADAYFFVPVDFDAASNFTFKKEIRYNEGPVLKVYYVKSADYTAGGQFDPALFTDITSSFNIVYPAIGSSDNSFSSAGTYSIPAGLTGTGFFVFEYAGTPTFTTTIQLDDIVIN